MMMRSKQSVRWTVSAIALTAGLGGIAPSFAQIDDVIVQAQRREEALQSVPIAVSAFNEEALDKQQIDNFSDLQFTVPNVSYSRGNFGSGANFQIRGIGSAAVANSGDGGVAFHINDSYLNAPRIADAEYFDLERVEILRGPQGTLYGRNATGGSVNMITKKPDFDEFAANIEAQYGNYNHLRFKGAVNVPLGQKAAVRVAGLWLDRDGYTENINPAADFDTVDGREQWAARFSLRVRPVETTTIDFMYSHFDEDDDRTRSTKQLCTADPSAILGCAPTGLGFATVNPDATLAGILVSNLVLAPPAASFGADLSLTTFGAGGVAPNPTDLRETFLDFEPIYQTEEDLFFVKIEHDLTPSLLLSVIANHSETETFSNQDYNNTAGGTLTVPAALAATAPTIFGLYYSGGCFPLSEVTESELGVIAGDIRECTNAIQAYDESGGSSEQTTVEVRISSDFDGPLNFQAAAYYLDFESDAFYYVVGNTLDYFSLVQLPALFGPAVDGATIAPPFFNSDNDAFTLETWAVFGELYWQVSPTVKLTGGLRYTHDEKFVRDRQYLFNCAGIPILTPSLDPILAGAVPPGADCNGATVPGVLYDGDAGKTGAQEYREDQVTFNNWTGRLVVDWTPDLAITDDSLFYASYSRGVRGGGFNPPFDPALFPATALSFDEEFVDAYEIGMKNTLANGKLRVNLTGFYYDYQGYQISKIVNRTSLNENIDTRVLGAEAEILFAPTETLFFNANIAVLDTEILDAQSIDNRDPTDGRTDVTLIKSLSDASNCVVLHNGAGAPPPPSAFLFPSPGGPTPGIAATSYFSALGCGPGFALSLPAPYTVVGGIEKDLSGNSLPQAPELTVSLGAQHTLPIANDMAIVSRLDYYWQDDYWTRIFNRPETDLVDAWDVWNANVTLYGPNERWSIRGFVQNILDEDNVTGHYLTDPSSGLFTNVFLGEPRLFGVNVTFNY